ncbi:LPS-assembly protein LptD [Comamonas koreensis]|uniref:LPS-assembly protein LptD n=1 Tax=Comamonas koreensis TaxID=160825 RepID=A0AAW4XWQ6_9BURK|nr:LPS-assembly protein LptD [Comamonas koreensis]MCD2165468.1 LPS-assembly protein LptD [Comamonas koreensis]
MDIHAFTDVAPASPRPAGAAAGLHARAKTNTSPRTLSLTPLRFSPTAIARLCMAMLWASPALVLAQAPAAGDDAGLVLRSSPRLQESLGSEQRGKMPVYLEGDELTGQTADMTTVTGNASLRRADTMIRADRLRFYEPSNTAYADGNVHINRAGSVFDGTELQMQLDSNEGFFKDANYRLLPNNGYGVASRVDFIDRERSVVHDGTYTTCQRNDEASWQPDWIIRAEKISIDNLEEVGVAENGVLEFKGVPIIPIPKMSFPLSEKRKSGLLPPTMSLDSDSGFTYAQPYYWNIAPNRDATITPTAMVKRGLALGGEFRYLEPTYSGTLAGLYMPGDRLRDRDRWSWLWMHTGSLDTPIGGLGLNINAKRVSDSDYWRDFQGNSYKLNERLLNSEASASWSRDDHSLLLRAQKWQTLQDPLSPIVPPYDRMPQLQYRYTPQNLPLGLEGSIEADATRFRADTSLLNQPNADRGYIQAELSRPFIAPQGYITPKLMLNTRHYNFDNSGLSTVSSASVTVPTVSLDTGLNFERTTRLFGRNLIQTLEPRAFYTYTPYRDQSMIPVYDTAPYDFSFATIFSSNSFSGYDRIADNNMLTVGATTRFLDAETGAEAARFGIAQRLRFSDQQVVMPNANSVNERWSDIMLGAGINWTPKWGFDTTVQFNPDSGRSVRSTMQARYKPGDYKTLALAYRYQAQNSEQMDLGWQWPVNEIFGSGGKKAKGEGRWYTVGRLNYSMRDKKLVDSVVGVEYAGCCWSSRIVLQRLQNSLVQSNTKLLFQMEFTGLTKLTLGADPLASMRENVPGYQSLPSGNGAAVPSRFSNYD